MLKNRNKKRTLPSHYYLVKLQKWLIRSTQQVQGDSRNKKAKLLRFFVVWKFNFGIGKGSFLLTEFHAGRQQTGRKRRLCLIKQPPANVPASEIRI